MLIEFPEQMDESLLVLAVGKGKTITVIESVFMHPVKVSSPVTVYVILVSGITIRLSPIESDRNVPGLQNKESPPDAVKTNESLRQML